MPDALRIANCSGFYGDRFSAAREMVEDGPIDVLMGEYLAELTMLILWRTRESGRGDGWASTFLRQLEQILGTVADRGKGFLGEGVAASDRSDPQAKGLGEYLRAREVEIPETLLAS